MITNLPPCQFIVTVTNVMLPILRYDCYWKKLVCLPKHGLFCKNFQHTWALATELVSKACKILQIC